MLKEMIEDPDALRETCNVSSIHELVRQTSLLICSMHRTGTRRLVHDTRV